MGSCGICCYLCYRGSWRCCEEVEDEDVEANGCGHGCLGTKCLVVVLILVASERNGGGWRADERIKA